MEDDSNGKVVIIGLGYLNFKDSEVKHAPNATDVCETATNLWQWDISALKSLTAIDSVVIIDMFTIVAVVLPGYVAAHPWL